MAKTYMFNNWQNLSEDYVPNNMFNLGEPPDGVKDIIRGTTPEHFLHVPFDVRKDVKKLIITYKQGLFREVNKYLSDVKVHEGFPYIIYFQFTEDETNIFRAYDNEPVRIELKACLTNGDIITSDIYEISVLDTLNHEHLEELPLKKEK